MSTTSTLHPFEKHWITITCAPESIIRAKELDSSILFLICNESKTKFVYVLASELRVLGIGRTSDELQHSKPMSYSDASNKIAELLELPIFIV